MKKIKLKNIPKQTIFAIRRFPLAVLLVFSISVYFIISVSIDFDDNGNVFFKYFSIGMLGVFYSVLLTVYKEITHKKILFTIVSNIVLLGVLIVGFLYLYNIGTAYSSTTYRIIVLYIVSFLGILFLPFLRSSRQNDFWLFNVELIRNLSASIIYFGVILLGLFAAFAVLDLLIFDIANIVYSITFSIIFFLGFVFFMSKFPQKYYLVGNEKIDYPKPLKILIQYILLPLTSLYLLILYIYSAKILLTWELPQGSVSYLVLIFSAIGIFSLMSVYPIRNEVKSIKIFSKYLYWSILPLIILLFVAIFRRISEYGITENRFFVLVLAFWLFFISVFMLITKQKNISIIITSFSLFVLISSFGPWSAFEVSKRHQLKRLNNILTENGIFENGKIIKNKKVSSDIYDNIFDISRYLIYNHGVNTIKDQFNLKIDDDITAYDFIDTLNLITFEEEAVEQIVSNVGFHYVSEILDIKQFDYLFNFKSQNNQNNFKLNDTLEVDIKTLDNILLVSVNSEQKEINLQDYFDLLISQYGRSNYVEIERKDAVRMLTFDNYMVKLVFCDIENYYSDSYEYIIDVCVGRKYSDYP